MNNPRLLRMQLHAQLFVCFRQACVTTANSPC
jgi:hypothetical protein